MKSKALRTFLFRPMEVAVMLAFMILMIKVLFNVTSPIFSWWMIGILTLLVPVTFALLFGILYLITWVFSIANQEVPE